MPLGLWVWRLALACELTGLAILLCMAAMPANMWATLLGKLLRALNRACKSPELSVQQLAVMSKGATVKHCPQPLLSSMLLCQCLHAQIVSFG